MKTKLLVFLVLLTGLGTIRVYDKYNNYQGRYERTGSGYNYYDRSNQIKGKYMRTQSGYNVKDQYNNYKGRLDTRGQGGSKNPFGTSTGSGYFKIK